MTKISSASIRLTLKKSKVNDIGENPIYLTVCFNGRKEKSTGVFIQERFWNPLKEEIRKTCPNAPVLNKMINDMKQRVINKRNDFEYNGRSYTPAMLLEDSIIDLSANRNEYRVIYRNYIAEMGLRENSIRLYDYNFNVLKKYFGREDFSINDVNLSAIKKLINSSALGDNSIRGICGRIGAIWNYAIDRGIVDSRDYPFREWKYSQRYKKVNRTYYLEEVNLIKLKDYFISHCLDISGGLYGYKPGMEHNLSKRSSKEFALLYFLILYRFNGSSPIDVALLRGDNCSRVVIDGEDYWKVEFKRKKTGMPIKCLLRRDILTMVGFEHYLMFSKGYIYPVLKEGMSDKQITNAVAKFCGEAIKKLRDICKEINDATIRNNVENGLEEPLIDVEHMVYYVSRHSLANSYLSQPKANVAGLASLMGRSADSISTYIHELRGDKDVADAVKDLPI